MIEQRTTEWFAQRVGRVTGSVVGAVLGLSPYASRDDVMRSMIRAAKGAPSEFEGNVATAHGTFHESNAIADYEIESCHDVIVTGFHEYEDWLGASPDGLIGDKGLLEVKCPFGIRKHVAPVFKSLDEQPHYAAQVQIELFATGRQWCHFYQWVPPLVDGNKLVRQSVGKLDLVKIDQDFLNDALPRLRQFHAEYLHELANNADDYLEPLRVTIDTSQAVQMVAEYDRLSEVLEQAGERKKELLAEMVALAGEKNALLAGNRKLTLTRKSGSVSYAKAIKELAPGADLSKWTGKASEYWGLK